MTTDQKPDYFTRTKVIDNIKSFFKQANTKAKALLANNPPANRGDRAEKGLP